MLIVKDLRRAALQLAWGAVLVSCGDDRSDDSGPAGAMLRVVSGDGQAVVVGARADSALVVRVEDVSSRAVLADVPVSFRVQRGAAVLSDARVRSGADGLARSDVSVEGVPGDTVEIAARVGSRPAVLFWVVIVAGPSVELVMPSEARSGDTITVRGRALHSAKLPAGVSIGQSVAEVVAASDTLLRVVVPPCLVGEEVWVVVARGGGRSVPRPIRYAAQESALALAPGQAVILDASSAQRCVRLEGAEAEYVVTAQFGAGATLPIDETVTLRVSGGPATALSLAPGADGVLSPSARLEAVLRSREQALAGVGGGVIAADAPAQVAALPPLGATRRYFAIATLDASRFDTVSAVLRYSGRNILVWVDTAARIRDEVLQPLSVWFDGELYATDVTAFGLPSDVDGDGRVHVVLTPVVNGLTPVGQCSTNGYVAGYVSAHDLYRGTPNAAGSEVFFGYVPDEAARWGCSHNEATWMRGIPLTFAHELQHLINYHQKVLARGGREEVGWLNEALSHVAEELVSLVHERRYPWPSGRGTLEQLFPDTAGWFITNNLVNSYLFLREPYRHSVTAITGGGTLEERGAGWLFVRWLTDRFGADLLRQLVQSPRRGADLLVDRTGVPMDRLLAEFTVMAYADSLPGWPRGTVVPELRLASRNLRTLYARLNVILNFPVFPITPTVVAAGQSVTGVLRSGGTFYARVTAPASGGVALQFARANGLAWRATEAPRLAVLRLP